jgi:hypothetical protein
MTSGNGGARRIGPIGTASRLLLGLAALLLAGWSGGSTWGIGWTAS